MNTEMKIGLYILTDKEDPSTCGRSCPFLDDGECDLWNTTLAETVLPPGWSWDYKEGPTRQRSWRCMDLTGEIE